jgi:mannose-6-phosphate isomerase
MDAAFHLPLRLAPNRVYRFYHGGALMDAFRGLPDPRDTDRPEDWVGSVTPAVNPPEHTYPGEGLSSVEIDGQAVGIADLLAAEPERVAGPGIVARYGTTTALLLKLLDAGSRLPVHGHPTRDFARRVLNSQFGKAEAWVVLATREIPGYPSPRVWLGMREDLERDELAELIARQDGEALRAAMNEFTVAPGDAIFVRPGLLHATGAGVFLVEAQEPTDFSVVAEWTGYPMDPEKAHLGLGWDTMLDCFDRRGVADEVATLSPRPVMVAGGPDEAWQLDDTLGEQSHPYFRIDRLMVRDAAPWPYPDRFGIGIVTEGEGTAETAHGAMPLRHGDTVALLADTAETTLSGQIELLVATPSFV